MAYKCPLCLKELSVDDKLIRYCYKCDQADFVKGNAESLKINLKCKKPFCKANGLVEEGIYFAHLVCEKSNPFWNGEKLNVPDNAKIDGIEITLPFPKGEPSFKHWQINLLSKTINSKVEAKISKTTNSNGEVKTVVETKKVSEVAEMWFPSVLLRAMEEKRTGKKLGQIVALIGTKKAGKTILALQALDEEGYTNPSLSEKIEIEDYIYCTRLGGVAIQPIFELLRLRNFMWANRPFYVPPPTIRETVNFYAAFFSPTKTTLQKKEAAEEAAKSSSIEQAKGVWGKVVSLWEYLTGAPKDSKKPFYFTLALYDVAGEAVEKEVEQIEKIKNSVDKIALVIDATDLIEIKGDEKGILAEHRRGLKKLKELGDKPFCVVLTKTDLFAQYLKTHPAFNYEVEQNRQGFYNGNQTVIKDLLENWKQTVATNSSPANRPINLLNFLSDLISLDNQTPIFMVETRNLPTDAEEMIDAQPFSLGLDTFVCWCLEIGRDEIIETN